jgi:hypothetical protein
VIGNMSLRGADFAPKQSFKSQSETLRGSQSQGKFDY